MTDQQIQAIVEDACGKAKKTIERSNKIIEDATSTIKKMQKYCNHNKSEYHHRSCAEDDCYSTCLICGFQWNS